MSLFVRWIAVMFVIAVSQPFAFCQDVTQTGSKTLRLDVTMPDSPAIYAGDQLITQYIPKSNTKPIFFPLQTVTGSRLNRNYSVTEGLAIEKKDHPHHRSFWFTFGSINDVDYWLETAKTKQGYVDSSSVKSRQENDSILIETDWVWKDETGKANAKSNQVFSFCLKDSVVHFESTIRLCASEGDLHFGDTKEGAFAVRVGELMKVDAKAGGEFVNDQGLINDAAWGKTARWVQYSGPAQIGDSLNEDATKLPTAGVTILVHPSSFGYPGRWHVRSYGLFAHNPFGIKDFLSSQLFVDDKEKSRENGFTVKSGEELLLRYLVLLHDGKLEPNTVDSIWNEFANR